MIHYKKIWLVLAIFICAITIYFANFYHASSFNEKELRDTSKLAIESIQWKTGTYKNIAEGIVVTGVLVNQDTRLASSVVLVVELRSKSDEVLAANPMVEVLNVPPQAHQPFETFLPAKNIPPDATAVARALVACWKE